MIENNLASGLDIDLSLHGLGIIKQPKVKSIMQLPFDENELTLPFLMIEKYYYDLSKLDIIDFDYTRLDIIPLLEQMSDENDKQEQNGFGVEKVIYSFSYKLFTLISLLYDVNIDEIEAIPSEESFYIMVGKKIIIDNNNFDYLIKVIFKIFNIDRDNINKEEDEWKEFTSSKKEKEMIEIFKEKERKKREKNRLHLCDLVIFIVVRDKRSFDEVLNWTYFQLLYVYKAGHYYHRTEIEERLFCSANTSMKVDDISNWQEDVKFKIDNTI